MGGSPLIELRRRAMVGLNCPAYLDVVMKKILFIIIFIVIPLWTLVISCTVNQISFLHLSAADKICLVNPNSVSISLCVVAFQVYYALRNTHSHEINLAVQQSDFSHIADIACALLINFAEGLNLR